MVTRGICVTDFCCAGELAGSSSSSFLGTDEAQASSSSDAGMDLAVASFPLSFLMSNCSALQGLDEQVSIPFCIHVLLLTAQSDCALS